MRKAGCFYIALVVMCFCSNGAGSLINTDQVLGRITDSAGNSLPGVLVYLQSMDGKPHVTGTDEQGVYRFETLASGRYQLRTEMFGFQPYEKKDIEVNSQNPEPLRIDIVLSMVRLTPKAPENVTPNPKAVQAKATPASDQVAPEASAANKIPTQTADSKRAAPMPQNRNQTMARGTGSPAAQRRGTQQPFQNVAMLNTPEAENGAVQMMSAANSSEALGMQGNADSNNMPSEAFLINGSINFGVQGGPQGPGGDFMNDPRF